MIRSKTTILVEPIPKDGTNQNKEAEDQSKKKYKCSLQAHKFIISQFTVLSSILELVGRSFDSNEVAIPPFMVSYVEPLAGELPDTFVCRAVLRTAPPTL